MWNLVLRALIREGLWAGSLTLLIVGMGSLTQVLLGMAILPDPALLVRLGGASLGIALGLALPITGLMGVLLGLRRIREDGVWIGLRTLGVGGWRLLPPVLGWVLGVGLLYTWAAHIAEPRARGILREARAEAVARIVPVAGRTVGLGPWSVVIEAERLHFIGEGMRGEAGSWRLTPLRDGVLVELRDGALHSDTVQAQFARLSLPLPLPGSSGRVEVAERPTPELRAHLQKTSYNPYEHWILWKRTLLPAAMSLLSVAMIPAALGDRAMPLLTGGALFGLWTLVRVLDQSVRGLGLGAATGVLLSALLVALAWGWGRWKER